MNDKKCDIKRLFGANVKKARKIKGLSQEQLAESVGIGISTLSKIECGKSYPNVETIEKIILKLEIDSHLLFMDEKNVSLDKMYKNILEKIDILKDDKILFKTLYDFVMFLDVK